MPRTCRFTAPYGSREIYRDGKPFITIHRDGGRPTDVDKVASEIKQLLCGERRTKSSLAGLGLWPFSKKKAAKPKQLPRDPRKMARTYIVAPGGGPGGVIRPLYGARRKRRRR